MNDSFFNSHAYMRTSESVTEGHPDKLCDQISDSILDTILGKDPYARVACETAVTNGLVVVMGEISTDCYVDVPQIVREVVRDVGYTHPEYGFEYQSCGVMVAIKEQSSDIASFLEIRILIDHFYFPTICKYLSNSEFYSIFDLFEVTVAKWTFLRTMGCDVTTALAANTFCAKTLADEQCLDSTGVYSS